MTQAFSVSTPIGVSTIRPVGCLSCSRTVAPPIGRCVVRTRRRRPRIVATAAAVTANNGTPTPDNKKSNLSATDARASLAGLMGTYSRLAMAEPFIIRRLVLAILCVVTSKFVALIVPLQFKRAVDALTLGASGGTTALSAFMLAITFHVTAAIIASLTRELRNGVFAKAGQRVGRRVTSTAFAHILSQDAAFHAAAATGALTRVVDRGTKSVLTIFRGLLFAFAPSLFELILVCCVLYRSFDVWYVGVTLITFIVYILYTFRLNDEMGRLRSLSNSTDNEAGAKLTDAFFNVDSVTAFNNFKFENSRYDETLKVAERLAVRNDWLYVALNFGQGAIFTTGLTIMLWRCGTNILAGTMSVGSFAMLYTMLQQLWVPLYFLGWQYREVKQSLIDLQNLFSVLERRSAIQEVKNATPLQVTGGSVEFENVTFAYPQNAMDLQFIKKPTEFSTLDEATTATTKSTEKRAYAIRNLSFRVNPGETLALVGPSGSGKSSTLKLLFRLFDVGSGRILVDGQDISKVTLSSLRESISIVPQDTVLFNDSIAYNIRYGRPDATDEEIVTAAKAASIHDTIARMPQGYETLVGERGVRLSGGERQRLSVARAFLKGSRIILEDESTSSLDSAMEAEVTRALRELGMNRTRVVIAHRLSTISDADKIVVIRDGHMVEEGTHNELLELPNGLYRELWQRQQDNRDDSTKLSSSSSHATEHREKRPVYQRQRKERDVDASIPREATDSV